MNIEKTTIVLVPETGYKRTITLKLIKAIPHEGKWVIKQEGFSGHIINDKNPKFAIIITDGSGKPTHEIGHQIHIHESRHEILKDYNRVIAYYKIMAYKEEHPEQKPTYQNGGVPNGWGGYEWPCHPWNK